jgi:hypothetical protein
MNDKTIGLLMGAGAVWFAMKRKWLTAAGLALGSLMRLKADSQPAQQRFSDGSKPAGYGTPFMDR